jgi:hypothetical protein
MKKMFIAICAVLILMSLSITAQAQLNTQLSSMGKAAVAQGSVVLSESLKSQLMDLATKILNGQPKDSIISQWKQIITGNKGINVDAAIGYLKQAIDASKLKLGKTAVTAQSTNELLQTLKDTAAQLLNAPQK